VLVVRITGVRPYSRGPTKLGNRGRATIADRRKAFVVDFAAVAVPDFDRGDAMSRVWRGERRERKGVQDAHKQPRVAGRERALMTHASTRRGPGYRETIARAMADIKGAARKGTVKAEALGGELGPQYQSSWSFEL